MTEEGIKKALKEANEFIRRARIVLNDPDAVGFLFAGGAKTGALRRQSMELTRALASMRMEK